MISNVEIVERGVVDYSLSELSRHAGRQFSALVEDAFFFAAEAHAGQIRKYSGSPYIVHPVHVACIAAKYAQVSDAEIAAFLLHDVLEDTVVNFEVLASLFGFEVANIVLDMTKRDYLYEGLSKSELKELDRVRLSKTGASAQTGKCADMLSNTRSMQVENPERFKTYAQENWLLFNTLHQADLAIRVRTARMFKEMGFF